MSTIESIQAITTSTLADTSSITQIQISSNQPAFTEYLQNINEQLNQADANLQDIALGKSLKTHEVLIQMEQAKMSFELMIETRNKLLEAYQQVMRMQI